MRKREASCQVPCQNQRISAGRDGTSSGALLHSRGLWADRFADHARSRAPASGRQYLPAGV